MDLKSLFAADRFAAQTGLAILEIREGYSRVQLKICPEHLNAVGTVQGGAIFTLADLAFAAAANSHGVLAVTLDASISYVKAVSQGTLVAEATEEAMSDRISAGTVRVFDDMGEVVALVKATAFRKRAHDHTERTLG